MRIGVVGVNHKTAELAVREKIARAFHALFSSQTQQLPSVLLSTCNRTELYFSSADLAAAHTEILQLLRKEITFPFEQILYSYFGMECFAHLSRVAAGLDSVILGESEIQKQVKGAYAQACSYHSLPGSLHFLFQKCLKIGKNVRTEFPFFGGQVSLEKEIFRLSALFAPSAPVLFIGNSEINRKIATFFKSKHQLSMTLCTRSPHAAASWGKKMQMDVYDWSHLAEWQRYPLIISGTYQEEYLLRLPEDSKNTQTRLLIDLSVPRSVDPKLSLHPHLVLLNIEELSHMLETSHKKQIQKSHNVEQYVRLAAERQMDLYLHRPAPLSLAASGCG